MNTKPKKSRKQRFNSWWRKNHHRQSAHKWLTLTSKRIAKAFFLPPDQFEDVVYICKRFAKSEYKRLNKQDAWCLWRVINPTVSQRTAALAQTAIMLDKQVERLKAEKQQENYRPIPDLKLGEHRDAS